MGVAYDLFGNGKTALKFNLGHYLDAATNDSEYTATARKFASFGRPPTTGRTEQQQGRRLHILNPVGQNTGLAGSIPSRAATSAPR